MVCITDHDQFWTPDELEVASGDSGVVLIPGSEINTDAGHVLCFGVTEYIFGFHRPEKLAAAILAANGAAIYAHPYRRNLPPGHEPVSEEQFESSIHSAKPVDELGGRPGSGKRPGDKRAKPVL